MQVVSQNDYRTDPLGASERPTTLAVMATLIHPELTAVDQWVGSAADPASTVVSAAVTPMFAVVALIGAVMVGLWYWGTGSPSQRRGYGPASGSPLESH